jgi:hypothetical protein
MSHCLNSQFPSGALPGYAPLRYHPEVPSGCQRHPIPKIRHSLQPAIGTGRQVDQATWVVWKRSKRVASRMLKVFYLRGCLYRLDACG